MNCTFAPDLTAKQGVSARRFLMHGVPIELNGAVDLLGDEIDALFKPFGMEHSPFGVLPVVGTLRRYQQSEVLRHLSSAAVRVATPGHGSSPLMELYQEGERFWLVDDRWGMAEVNLLKGCWRSWILPQPTLDARRCAEMAVLWPLAQVMRGRGLHLLPAASVARDEWGALLLGPFNIDAELAHLAHDGFRTIGQRWSCLREEGGGLTLLHVPGRIRVPDGQRLLPEGRRMDRAESTVNPSAGSETFPNSAVCEVVVTFEPSRRPVALAKELPGQLGLDSLRRNWPIIELHRARRHLPVKLAATCRCCEVRLSQRPEDLLVLLSSLQNSKRQSPARAGPSAFRSGWAVSSRPKG